MKRLYLILFAYFMIGTCSIASTYLPQNIASVSAATTDSTNIWGVVVDSLETPLPYANVVIYSSADSSFVMGTVTDANGRFSMKCLPLHKQLLRVSCMGSQTLCEECV